MVIISDPKISKAVYVLFNKNISIMNNNLFPKLAPALTNYNIKYAQKHFENLENLSQQDKHQQAPSFR
jgi:hypothetical protein